MDALWERAAVSGAVIVVTLVVAKLVDGLLVRRLEHRPETLTRYRVVRRSAVATILTVGILSALLVIPGVRTVAGTILASSAVLALILGFAAQTTLSNFVAGLLVAFSQPLRLGDAVDVGNASGVVEEIGLTYTVIRSADGARYFVPNAKLASDTIRNATLTSSEHRAQVAVAVPLSADLERVRELLVEEARQAPESMPEKEPVATVSQLEPSHAVLTVDAWTRSAAGAGALASNLRATLHRRLREEGIYA